MKKLFRKYKELPFEQKVIINTAFGLCFSAALTGGKLIIGFFTDFNLCRIALYTFAMLLAKFECLKGAKSEKRAFRVQNILISVFLFLSSVLYVAFMWRSLYTERTAAGHGIMYVSGLAFIAFLEFGLAVAGIIRTKNKGYFYRDIKIINFCIALIAVLTAQMAILDYTSTANVVKYNAFAGMGIGAFIAACAFYILIAPKISLVDRERCAFILKDGDKNGLIDMSLSSVSVPLCKSRVYGSFYYNAMVYGDKLDGNIEADSSLWKRMNLTLKIVCCIFSEILIFVWLAGRIVFFFRSVDLPRRLEAKLKKNGFEPIQILL